MGDMYEYDKNGCSSSGSVAPQQTVAVSAPADEISLFLQQILFRSSSSDSSMRAQFSLSSSPSIVGFSASSGSPDNLHRQCRPQLPGEGISTVDSASGAYALGSACGNTPNVSSNSLGASENENDEFDCESEEGVEALVEDAPTKPVARSSSKRSRAAEVHNLSEKRRRSRINEKMKALQNLIPNSNKTDKASMLDEAIEYLKQLQLQVQMLSMRNGLSLHPMCVPGGALPPIQHSQMRMDFGEGNRSLHLNMSGTLPMIQETLAQNLFGLSNQCTASNSNQEYVPNLTNIISSETSFGMEQSIEGHLGLFQLHASAEEICKDVTIQHQQTNANHLETIPLGGSAASVAFNSQTSDIKVGDSLETCIIERHPLEGGLPKPMEQSLVLPSHLDSMCTGRSVSNDNIKMERRDL